MKNHLKLYMPKNESCFNFLLTQSRKARKEKQEDEFGQKPSRLDFTFYVCAFA